ncbi:MAG: protein-L-isoaspartate(D-aspartate) O-methyltransferase [Myxococcales bacterium]|nr:MAG: protein-L-isoaspartate(D-aspartate) O-methyltransferase [Myxococcales bacterium]
MSCGQHNASVRPNAAASTAAFSDRNAERDAMVREQIESRGISQKALLDALRKVPRHAFVPEAYQDLAYADGPLPIDWDQTISQPYIVALMTSLAQIEPGDKVLEVGTGSAYQAAILSSMGAEVYTIEIVEGLALRARATLEVLGYTDVHAIQGDGYAGWPSEAPFDAIIVTAAPPYVPPALKEQLQTGGRLVIPVGVGHQKLVVIERDKTGFSEKEHIPVSFVPMTGQIQESEKLRD